MVKKYGHIFKLSLILALCSFLQSGCGIKPANLKAPEPAENGKETDGKDSAAQAPKTFPQIYPDLSTDPAPSK